MRPTLTISGIRAPLQLWKAAHLMASSPLETRSTGAVLDVALRAAGAAPHRAVVRSVLRSTATCCVVGRCIWAGLRTRWAQEPASRCCWPACLMPSWLQPMPLAASIFESHCHQHQRMPEGVAARWRPSISHEQMKALGALLWSLCLRMHVDRAST